MGDSSQLEKEFLLLRQSGHGRESVIPNAKAKLLDQVREVMRLRHYAIRTEQSYCDWIRRCIKFHVIYTHVLRRGGSGMKSPLDCL